MAVKYRCPKCEKRFIDWGAEKLGFVCPECEGEKLLEVSHSAAKDQARVKKPAKRKKKKKAVVVSPKAAVEASPVKESGEGFEGLAGGDIDKIDEFQDTAITDAEEEGAAGVDSKAIKDIKKSEAPEKAEKPSGKS